MGEILGVRLRLIACAVGRRCLLIADEFSIEGTLRPVTAV
jgi:hypothetical protein